MEVSPNIMYLEIEYLSSDKYPVLIKQLGQIPQIDRITPISHMPHQEREQQLTAVMDTIGDGILAIDQQEVITHFNSAAEKILSYQSSEVIGAKVGAIFISEIPLLETLRNGLPYNNREIVVKTFRGKNHYLTFL